MNKQVITTYKEAEEFFKDFNKEVFAFDTETNGLNYYDMELESIQFCDGKKACYISSLGFESSIGFRHIINKMFKNAKIIIAHNIPFDLKVLKRTGIHIPEEVELYDTMVADHLLDENRSHKLKDLANKLLGHKVISYEEAKAKGGQVFIDYGMNDAIWTWELAQYQRPLLEQQGLIPLFREIEMPFQRCMLDMATNGVLIHTDKLVEFTKDTKQIIENLSIQLHGLIDQPYSMQFTLTGESTIVSKLNLNSSLQLSEILFDKLGLPVIETTPAGKRSVGKKTINVLKDKHEFVKLLHTYKKAQKLYTSFLLPMDKFIDGDNRIRPDFKDTGTKTGRLSCRQPNLQQLAKHIDGLPNLRELFVVPENKKMIACDYSGQELRVLTQITKSDTMIDTFNKGKDMHLSTANDFFELNIPEEALYTNHPDCNEYKHKFYDERNKAKIINFGMAYGKGAYGFSQDFNISEQEAQEILDKYFGALPKVKQAIDDSHRQVRELGYVTSLTNRRRRFFKNEQGYYPNSAFRQAFNFIIQGTSADMIRKAMVKVREFSLGYPYSGFKLLFTVHDEAVYEVNHAYADMFSKEIKRIFEEEVAKFVIPIKADVEIGCHYGEVK